MPYGISAQIDVLWIKIANLSIFGKGIYKNYNNLHSYNIDRRFAEFVEGASHLTQAEVMDYSQVY
jgi:hypothetical protein